jgi:hypothetical protein
MDESRIDTLMRRLETGHSRRSTLERGLAALGAIGLTTVPVGAQARKRKRKRRKRPKPPTCREACGSACGGCARRAEGGFLCYTGTTSSSCANTCQSDDDCVGSGYPYCVRSIEFLVSGLISHPCGAGVAACTSLEDACTVA